MRSFFRNVSKLKLGEFWQGSYDEIASKIMSFRGKLTRNLYFVMYFVTKLNWRQLWRLQQG